MKYGPWTITEADGELHASIVLPTPTLTQAVYALNIGVIDGYSHIVYEDGNIEHILHTTGDDLQDLIAALIIIHLESSK